MKKRELFLLLVIGSVILLVATGVVFAAGKVQAYGIITSIEEDGTVIIDDIGYFVSSSVTVHDLEGRRISLKDIPLPHNVKFEYEYARQGFTIIFIKMVSG